MRLLVSFVSFCVVLHPPISSCSSLPSPVVCLQPFHLVVSLPFSFLFLSFFLSSLPFFFPYSFLLRTFLFKIYSSYLFLPFRPTPPTPPRLLALVLPVAAEESSHPTSVSLICLVWCINFLRPDSIGKMLFWQLSSSKVNLLHRNSTDRLLKSMWRHPTKLSSHRWAISCFKS